MIIISIIIIVKNDRGLKSSLRHITNINKPEKTEIIVVDSSQGKLDDIKNKFHQTKWISFISRNNKKITIPEQRNVGVNAAKGKIIVFIDANCIPDKQWLNELTYPILKEKELLVCGRTKSAGDKTIHDQLHDNIKNKQYIDECATINLAIKKSIFKKIGLFDENFDYGSDIDFTWRAIEKGFRIRYSKKAIVTHDWGNTKQEIKRSFLYGSARAKLYKKHINRLSRLIKKDYFVLFYIVFILFFPIIIIFPYYLLLLIIPFLKNINKNPIRVILDHLVYAVGFIYENIRLK